MSEDWLCHECKKKPNEPHRAWCSSSSFDVGRMTARQQMDVNATMARLGCAECLQRGFCDTHPEGAAKGEGGGEPS